MFEFNVPGGHATIFGVQVGGGATQSQYAPGGVEVRLTFVRLPEQISLVRGGLRDGAGFIVTASADVGPGSTQLVFVP